MGSSKDNRIISLWLERQPSPHTRGCYQRDSAKLLKHVGKPLKQITLGDLQSFAQFLIGSGLAPISNAGGREESITGLQTISDQSAIGDQPSCALVGCALRLPAKTRRFIREGDPKLKRGDGGRWIGLPSIRWSDLFTGRSR